MLGLNSIKEENISLSYNHVDNIKTLKKSLNVPNYFARLPDDYEKRYLNDNGKYKVLIFRDSFSDAMLKFLTRKFKETVFIWQYNPDENIVLAEKPDIIILEIVERNIDVLLDLSTNGKLSE